MKSGLLRFALPIGMGLTLLFITFFGIISTTMVGCEAIDKECGAGSLLGTDGKCYGPCEGGSYVTYSAVGNCSAASAGGVYCCIGSGGTGGTSGGTKYCNPGNTYNYSSQKCCPNSAPYYYPGTHGISSAGCYASCPYVGDCGTNFTKY